MAVMAGETWADERMDDLARRVDDGFARVDLQLGEVRAESRELRRELVATVEAARAETKALGEEINGRFDSLQRILIVVLFGGVFTLVAAALTALAAYLF